MQDNLDDGVRRALVAARNEALSRSASEISSEYLLLGLLAERTPLVNALLGALGIDTEQLIKQVQAATPRKGRVIRDLELPLSGLSDSVLTQAAHEAQGFGSEVVHPEHLLLALMCNAQAPIGRLFAANNVRVDRARTALRDVMTRPPELHRPPQQTPSPRPKPRRGSDFTIIWDPTVMDPDDYARLVSALGDLARASGGLGIQRVGTNGVRVGEPVGVRC
jgi:ATP-dependent Clp protease ATP-binding subunit ClpA